MKKIMFNDRYGLTQAVLEGRKTMTRRIVPQSVVDYYTYEAEDPTMIDAARFEVGEIVAVAQAYRDVYEGGFPVDSRYDPFRTAYSVGGVKESDKGWSNKMFVKADLMPLKIRITGVKVERLQDISDEDCIKEGIYVSEEEWRYTYRGADRDFETLQEAFASLIDKISGKGTWDADPWVYAYEFELIK